MTSYVDPTFGGQNFIFELFELFGSLLRPTGVQDWFAVGASFSIHFSVTWKVSNNANDVM